MVRKGLSKEKIIEASIKLIREKGYKNFSIRGLAETLDVKPPSLYKHIKNLDELTTEIAVHVIKDNIKHLFEAIEGKPRNEALIALSNAFIEFVKEERDLYHLLMAIPMLYASNKREHEELISLIRPLAQPIFKVLRMYDLTPEQEIHYIRFWRSSMHGYVELNETGYFYNYSVDKKASYDWILAKVIDSLQTTEEANKKLSKDT